MPRTAPLPPADSYDTVPVPPPILSALSGYPELIPYYRTYRNGLGTVPPANILNGSELDDIVRGSPTFPDNVQPHHTFIHPSRADFPSPSPAFPPVVSPISLLIHLLTLLREQDIAGSPLPDNPDRVAATLAPIVSAYRVIRPPVARVRALATLFPAKRSSAASGHWFTPIPRYGFTLHPVKHLRDRSLPRTLSVALLAEISAAIAHHEPDIAARVSVRHSRNVRAADALNAFADAASADPDAPASPYLSLAEIAPARSRHNPTPVYLVPSEDLAAAARAMAELESSLVARAGARAAEAASDERLHRLVTAAARRFRAFAPAGSDLLAEATTHLRDNPPAVPDAAHDAYARAAPLPGHATPPPRRAPPFRDGSAPPPGIASPAAVRAAAETPPLSPVEAARAAAHPDEGLNVRDLAHAEAVLAYLPDDSRPQAAARAAARPYNPDRPTAFPVTAILSALKTILAPHYPSGRLAAIITAIRGALSDPAADPAAVADLGERLDLCVTESLTLERTIRTARAAHARRSIKRRSPSGPPSVTLTEPDFDPAKARETLAMTVIRRLNLPDPE